MAALHDEHNGREELVRALVNEGIRDPRVIAAFRGIPRKPFVPPSEDYLAYADVPVDIGHEQTTTQPSLIACMVEALRLDGDERVLEIGMGLGFQTAILASLCSEVYSVERFDDLAEQAQRNLAKVGIRNAHVVTGDGTFGLAEHAPYDAIITCAAATRVPPALAEQLREGGRLVHPLGPGGNESVLAYRKEKGELVVDRRLVHALFVPMIGAGWRPR